MAPVSWSGLPAAAAADTACAFGAMRKLLSPHGCYLHGVAASCMAVHLGRAADWHVRSNIRSSRLCLSLVDGG